MDPVSGADRLAALLRQRLLERSRAAGTATREQKEASGTIDRIYASGPVEPQEDRQRRRALIQTILAEEIGPGLINDAGFQQVVDRVLGAIEDDEAAAALLGRVTSALSGPSSIP
jgi:hypothetical protein